MLLYNKDSLRICLLTPDVTNQSYCLHLKLTRFSKPIYHLSSVIMELIQFIMTELN